MKRSDLSGQIRFPGFNVPAVVQNSANFKFSRPLAFKSGLDLSKIRILPEFKRNDRNPNPIPPFPNPNPEFNYNPNNFIDTSRR